MIVAFTGHRPNKLGGYDEPNPVRDQIRAALRELLAELHPAKAISGMALGVDQWAAEMCIELEIPFIAAVPFDGQEDRWPPWSREKYAKLLKESCEMVKVCSAGYAPEKMQKRNEWMVDHCDVLIAVWDGTSGGTANCVRYAESIGKRIIMIAPIWSVVTKDGKTNE